MKARDAKRLADFKQVSTAMHLYYDAFGIFPGDNTLYANSPESHNAQFEAMVQQLISAKFMNAVPKDPLNNAATGNVYMYYNYGPGNAAGAIITTNFENVPATTTALYGSCRPFTTNWCSSTLAQTYLCMCHSY
jgi:hypothetical protein